jgi:hypothetical protein
VPSGLRNFLFCLSGYFPKPGRLPWFVGVRFVSVGTPATTSHRPGRDDPPRFACANSIFFVHLFREQYDTNETCNDQWYRNNKAMHLWTRLRLFVQLINTVRQ